MQPIECKSYRTVVRLAKAMHVSADPIESPDFRWSFMGTGIVITHLPEHAIESDVREFISNIESPLVMHVIKHNPLFGSIITSQL